MWTEIINDHHCVARTLREVDLGDTERVRSAWYPTSWLFAAASMALLAPTALLADVTGRVETHTAPRTGPSQAIVYAEPVDRPAPARPATPRLLQRDKTFIPAVIVVPVGSTVDFPNQDDIFHNVFSLSAPAPFDLGLYRAGATKKRTFAQPGTYRVFCNIHPQMTAFIVVVPTPYIATVGEDGRYSLELPPGTYRVTARSDRATPTAVEVTVKTGNESVPDITLDESRYVSVPHKNKFGQDYPASAYEKKEDGR
jgi:plastocyanin